MVRPSLVYNRGTLLGPTLTLRTRHSLYFALRKDKSRPSFAITGNHRGVDYSSAHFPLKH